MKAMFSMIALLVAGTACAESPVSDSAFVFLQPKASFFWHTATNNTISLPVVFPPGADSATLTVTGLYYTASYPGITTNEFLLELPPATSPNTENVYELTLTFNDGTVRMARLGLIQGLVAGSEGSTRCIAPFGSARWRKVDRLAVMPIPFGITSFLLRFDDGSEVSDTGLDGAAGWYAIALSGHGEASLAMTDSYGDDWTAAFNGVSGTLIQFR